MKLDYYLWAKALNVPPISLKAERAEVDTSKKDEYLTVELRYVPTNENSAKYKKNVLGTVCFGRDLLQLHREIIVLVRGINFHPVGAQRDRQKIQTFCQIIIIWFHGVEILSYQ